MTLAVLALSAACAAQSTTSVEQSASPAIDQIDVLFVGNSYTYYNDMPEMVEAIAAANGANIDATMIAGGGLFLDDHVARGEAATALQSGEFEVVIFQEQSLAPALSLELSRRTLPAVAQLDAVADAAGTRVILYQTWGRESGFPDFGFRNFDDMQSLLNQGYREMATASGAEIARVGESFQQILRSGTGVDLFDDDGSHPSAIGSYAAAFELAETILGEPMTTAPSVAGVDDDTAAVVLAFG